MISVWDLERGLGNEKTKSSHSHACESPVIRPVMIDDEMKESSGERERRFSTQPITPRKTRFSPRLGFRGGHQKATRALGARESAERGRRHRERVREEGGEVVATISSAARFGK